MGTDIERTRDLTEQQQMAAYYLAMGLSRQEVSKKVGCSDKSISVWSNHNDAFKQELEKWKASELDRLGTSLVRAQLEAIGLTESAASVLREVLTEKGEDGLPSGRAVKAAIEIFRKLPLGEQVKSEDGATAIAQAAVFVVNMGDDGKPTITKQADIEATAVEVE